MQLAQQPNPPPAGHYCISKWRLLRHTASLNIPEGLLAQQDPGLMRKLPLLSPLLHPLFIIAFLIKHATTSFPVLPHTLCLRHIPRRPLWKIKSQPTERCLWCVQKSSLQLWGARHCPREPSPALGKGRAALPGEGRSRARLIYTRVRQGEAPSHPSLASSLPFPALSSCAKGKSLSHLSGAGCQQRGFCTFWINPGVFQAWAAPGFALLLQSPELA